MTHVIQNALTMLRAGEWMPVTAARVLIGIFFCISGGTKLFVPAQFGLLEQTMVQIRVPYPHATSVVEKLCASVATQPDAGSFDCVRLAPHSAQDDSDRGRSTCRSKQAHSSELALSAVSSAQQPASAAVPRPAPGRGARSAY